MKNLNKKISWLILGAVACVGSAFGQAPTPPPTPPPEEEVCHTTAHMNAQSLFLSAAEAAGAKYRKIGLNGFPIPDEKPQQAAESDEEPEETYIDAFNHNLTHQVTDVYIPMQGSDLTLTVRRNWSPEIWQTYGMKPTSVRPDLPFGAGWKTNIGASIKFVYPASTLAPVYAYVTDTNGVSYRFLVLLYFVPGEKTFFPMPENRHQQEALATTLVQDGDHYIFTNKYGTRLKFDEPPVSPDTESPLHVREIGVGSTLIARHAWGRLLEAKDRYGTTMDFYFGPSNEGLIPDSISCRGKTIEIRQANGRVSEVEDPRGNVTAYTYADESITPANWTGAMETAKCLTTVTRADNTETNYTYEGVSEADVTPKTQDDPTLNNSYFYLDLETIEDPNGNTFEFGYAYDKTRWAYMLQPHYEGWYKPHGNPRQITRVDLPGGSFATFGNTSRVFLTIEDLMMTFKPAGNRTLQVTDAAGGQWTYDFTEPSVAMMDEFTDLAIPEPDEYNKSVAMMIFYEKMTVSTPEGGEMVAIFDKTAGMALKSFKDVGATAATTYTHDDEMDLEFKFPFFSPAARAEIPAQKWSDPTSQTNGKGDTKHFEYSGPWRIMSKVIDEDGRVTETEVDATNGNRKWEEIRLSASSPVVQRTVFQYDNTFTGILKKTTVQKQTGDPAWAVDLVTENTLEPITGNIKEVTTGTSVTHATYDENNNKKTSTDANGNVTTFFYDELNRLTDVTLPDLTTKEIRYDDRGNKTHEIDERGYATLYAYDALNRVKKLGRDMDGDLVFSGSDIVTEFDYNALNAKTFVTDPRGNKTETRYDGLNRPVKVIDALLEETVFEYGANSGGIQFGKDFLPVKKTDPRGYVTDFTYDANNRPTVVSAQYALTGTATRSVTETRYDKAGNVVKVIDPLGRETQTQYDALKRPVKVINPDLTESEIFYTSTGLKWKVEDELNYDTQTEYDNQGRPVKVFSPLVDNGLGVGTMVRPVTQTVYDAAGNVKKTINPRGYTWEFTYDTRNRKTHEIRPGVLLPTYEWRYDAVGNVEKTIDARGNATETKFDRNNRPYEVLQPFVPVYGSGTARPLTVTKYDKAGNIERLTDPNGHQTNNTYDKLNRLKTTTDAEGIVVTNEYDEVGNKTDVIDGKGQRTEFEYDGLNRNTKVIDAAGKATTFEYNALNKTDRLDAKGQRTKYGYDNRNRLETVSYIGKSADDRVYDYDAVGNLVSVTEAHASKAGKADVVYSHDALKRILTEKSNGVTHTYRYDVAGNRTYCLYGGFTNALVFAYDEQNRLLTLTEGTRVSTYTYDLDGNNLTKSLPNGNVVTSTYDRLSRTATYVGNKANGNMIYSYVYGYDKVGNVKAINETFAIPAANRTIVMSYDDINRLEEEAITGNGAITTGYEYDDAHNRKTMVQSGTTTSYYYNNSLNQLTSTTTGTSTIIYTYDDNGNRATRVKGATTDTFGWDYENRLTTLTKQSPNGNGTYGWMYDYRTRRVGLTKNPTTTNITFSGGVSVGESVSGTATVGYVRGSDWGGGVGGILYTLRPSGVRFNHYNRRGDMVIQMDPSETTTFAAQYKAFGDRSETGSSADRQRSNTKDEDVPGYANEGFRFRDIETGAFLSRDPAGFVDGPNLYAYVVQNPWTMFDPDGLKGKKPKVAKPTWKDARGSTVMPDDPLVSKHNLDRDRYKNGVSKKA